MQSSHNIMENIIKSDPIQNTLRLTQLWHQKYSKRGENDNIFSGNVQQYEFKLIEQSDFIILRNKSRMQRRVENLQLPNNTEHQANSQPRKRVVVGFQPNRFHFQLIYPEQVVFFYNNLMDFQEEEKAKQIVFGKQQIISNQSDQNEIHCAIINKAPICPSHCLFVPWINGKPIQVGQQVKSEKLCQKIIPEAIPLVFHLLKIYDDVCIGYNSVGASASVNNLHFHMFFKDHWIGKHKIPIQLSLYDEKTDKIVIDVSQGMQISAFDTKLIQGFHIIISLEPGPGHFKRITKIFQKLIAQNIPHNMIIMKKSQNIEVVIFTRDFETQTTKFACMQYAGVFCLDYETTTKEIIQQKFKQMRIQQSKFKELIEHFKEKVQGFKEEGVSEV